MHHQAFCSLHLHLMCGTLTFAVVEVAVGGSVVLAQPLQDELVVHEALDGLEQEGVEGQVAHLLQLKLLVDRLQLLQSLGGFLQLRQHLVVLLQEAGELLGTNMAIMKPRSPVTSVMTSKRRACVPIITFREHMFFSITSPILW